jgi:eukaryotic-like serine/threonine-protein kinase
MASQSQGMSAPAVPGSVLAERYRVLRRLGSGGMATVLLAEDNRLGRRVAVKRLHTGSPEEAAGRLNREARLGASLNHPNLVTVYDAQPDGESLLIVMEFVDGSSLSA